MDVVELMKVAVEKNATDLHLTVGVPPMVRLNGGLIRYGDTPLKIEDTEGMAKQILDEAQMNQLNKVGEIDVSYTVPGISRFRVNIYKQRSSIGIAARIIWMKIPTIDELGLPAVLKEVALRPRGIVLVTGPTGSGKSTTLAAMINHININRNCHILTLEDPIEYMHRHGRSIVNQREIGSDSLSFKNSLRAALREDPDVILVGEMRDHETIETALTAAETGHLVFSTLHTAGAAKTIDRIIDVFPPYQQQQVRVQLAGVFQGAISQQLMPLASGKGLIPAFEILLTNSAVANLIREGKTHQIQTIIQTNTKNGMTSMDYSLAELFKKNLITAEDAESRCYDKELLNGYINRSYNS